VTDEGLQRSEGSLHSNKFLIMIKIFNYDVNPEGLKWPETIHDGILFSLQFFAAYEKNISDDITWTQRRSRKWINP